MENTKIKSSEFRALVRECIKEVLAEVMEAKKARIAEANKSKETKK
jgi:hypothetical protein